jgi:hypothetical protein
VGAFITTGAGGAGGGVGGGAGAEAGIASPDFLPQWTQNCFPGSIPCPQKKQNPGVATGAGEAAGGIGSGTAAGGFGTVGCIAAGVGGLTLGGAGSFGATVAAESGRAGEFGSGAMRVPQLVQNAFPGGTLAPHCMQNIIVPPNGPQISKLGHTRISLESISAPHVFLVKIKRKSCRIRSVRPRTHKGRCNLTAGFASSGRAKIILFHRICPRQTGNAAPSIVRTDWLFQSCAADVHVLPVIYCALN